MCLCQQRNRASSSAKNSTPTDQPQRKPVSNDQASSTAWQSEVVAVVRHLRSDGRNPPGTVELVKLLSSSSSSSSSCNWQPAAVPAVAWGLLPRRHWSSQLRDDGPWETVRFQLQLPVHGALCHLSSEMNSHRRPFDSNWKQYYSGHPLARMLLSELRHCQHVTVLVCARWLCNVSAWQCHSKY